MPTAAITYGIVLIILGLGGYLLGSPAPDTGVVSKTALIPAWFGIPALLLGLVALRGGNVRKHAMHGAAMVSLLGPLAPLGRIIPAITKGTFELKLSTGSMILMMIASLIFLIMCIRSFIAARRARTVEVQA